MRAVLALEDGNYFEGEGFGAEGRREGEVCFNTSMTGYQEILTDPSYCQQIVTLTYPHIGNYGVNPEDIEADRVHAAGLIIKNLPLLASNFRSTQSLGEYLQANQTVAIADIDTRKLTRVLRTTGAQNGCIQGFAPGVEPTPANVASGKYPLTLEFGLIHRSGALTQGGRAFIDYLRTPVLETTLMDQPTLPPLGVGEGSQAPAGAARRAANQRP